MNWFIIKTSKMCPGLPHLVDWKTSINPQDIAPGRSYHLPDRQKIFYTSDEYTVYPGLLTYPFRMVSTQVKKAIQLYQPDTLFKEVILVEKNKDSFGDIHNYYIPIPEEVNCMQPHRGLLPGTLRNVVIDKSKLTHHCVFLLRHSYDVFIVANMDVVESILMRGAVGIDLIAVCEKQERR